MHTNTLSFLCYWIIISKETKKKKWRKIKQKETTSKETRRKKKRDRNQMWFWPVYQLKASSIGFERYTITIVDWMTPLFAFHHVLANNWTEIISKQTRPIPSNRATSDASFFETKANQIEKEGGYYLTFSSLGPDWLFDENKQSRLEDIFTLLLEISSKKTTTAQGLENSEIRLQLTQNWRHVKQTNWRRVSRKQTYLKQTYQHPHIQIFNTIPKSVLITLSLKEYPEKTSRLT